MAPWLLAFGGIGLFIMIIACLDDSPVLPEDASDELVEWHAFLKGHAELRR